MTRVVSSLILQLTVWYWPGGEVPALLGSLDVSSRFLTNVEPKALI